MITPQLLSNLAHDTQFNEFIKQYVNFRWSLQTDMDMASVYLEMAVKRTLALSDEKAVVMPLQHVKKVAKVEIKPLEIEEVQEQEDFDHPVEVEAPKKKRGRPPKKKADSDDETEKAKEEARDNLRKKPITAAERAKSRAEDAANTPKPGDSLKVAVEVCKKSLAEGWTGPTKVVRLKQERNISGLEEALKKEGCRFSSMTAGIEMSESNRLAPDERTGEITQRQGWWRITFTL